MVFGSSSYTVHENTSRTVSLNWEESRRHCKETGSDLVSIESAKEWIFLKNTIQSMKTVQYFIGLKKDSKSGEWRWISDYSKVNATVGRHGGKTADWLKNPLSWSMLMRFPLTICGSKPSNV